jgi:hypothetical protein
VCGGHRVVDARRQCLDCDVLELAEPEGGRVLFDGALVAQLDGVSHQAADRVRITRVAAGAVPRERHGDTGDDMVAGRTINCTSTSRPLAPDTNAATSTMRTNPLRAAERTCPVPAGMVSSFGSLGRGRRRVERLDGSLRLSLHGRHHGVHPQDPDDVGGAPSSAANNEARPLAMTISSARCGTGVSARKCRSTVPPSRR